MGLNTGYLKAERTEESNEQYTPFYAVDPITKYIPKTKKIWCPFDCERQDASGSLEARM